MFTLIDKPSTLFNLKSLIKRIGIIIKLIINDSSVHSWSTNSFFINIEKMPMEILNEAEENITNKIENKMIFILFSKVGVLITI